MLTGVFETLRSAGRALVLELGERPSLPTPLDGWKTPRAVSSTTPPQPRRSAPQLGAPSRCSRAIRVPSGCSTWTVCRREASAQRRYDEARRAVEQAALDEAAAHDRGLLGSCSPALPRAYQAAKDRESALDFEDLQLRARDLLRANADHPSARAVALPPRSWSTSSRTRTGSSAS